MPRPAHVSQRLRGGGPPVRRRLRDRVYTLPTLPHASQARQASTAAASAVCRHRSRAPLDRRNGVTRRTNNSIISIVYGIAIASLASVLIILAKCSLWRCSRLCQCLASVRTRRIST